MTFFWLLLLAHGVADFILQSNSISMAKCKNQWQGYVRHGLAVLLCTFAALHFFGWLTALAAAGLITGVHLLLDWLKNTGRAVGARLFKTSARPGMPGLLLDQALHVLSLLWVWYILDRPVNAAVAGFYSKVLSPVNSLQPDWHLERVVPVLAIYVLVAFGGAVLVRMGLDQLVAQEELQGTSGNSGASAGKYIGILERVLITTLAATGNISAIGFVFTAKSIARYSELSDRKFAEYYLIGTLVSFLLALVGGIILNRYIL